MNKKILVTGPFGQIGSEFVPVLQEKYGKDNVIALGHIHIPSDFDGVVERGDVTDRNLLEMLIKKHNIQTVFHFVSILSANGEKDPQKTWHLNISSLQHFLELARTYGFQLFWPSSIAVFGPTTPRVNTPQRTILEPATMYGVTKLAGENLCNYYFRKYGVDVRSLRYPSIISYKAEAGGGTSDFAVEIFKQGLTHGEYEIYLREDTVFPMMYMNDTIKATLQLMDCDPQSLTVRTSYNVAGFSFAVRELVQEVQKYIPVNIRYKPDFRQQIADSWPDIIDDAQARSDWGWQAEYDLQRTVKEMVDKLKV